MDRRQAQRAAARLEGGGWASVRREIQATAGRAEPWSWMVQEADFGDGLVVPCKDGTCEEDTLLALAMGSREPLRYRDATPDAKAGNATTCALRHVLRQMAPPGMEAGRVPLDVAVFFLRGVKLSDLAKRAGLHIESMQRALPKMEPHTILWGEAPRYIFQRGVWKIIGVHMGQRERTILLDTAAPPRLCPLVSDVAR